MNAMWYKQAQLYHLLSMSPCEVMAKLHLLGITEQKR